MLLVAPHVQLTSLSLQLCGGNTDAAINNVLATLATLPSLSRLRLKLASFAHETAIELSLLAACRSLTVLTVAHLMGCAPVLTEAQVNQIRSCLGHLSHFSVGQMHSNELERFLQPPSTARWRDIGFVYADANTAELLLRLPTLTRLDLTYDWTTPHVEFLPQLSHLTTLKLDCHHRGRVWFIPANALLASLLLCPGLTQLKLTCGFDSTHWSALFARLTRLKTLTIRGGELNTLKCFAAGPITQSLEKLIIDDYALPPIAVNHLYALRRLRTLDLRRCFQPHLDSATIASLSPPTPLLPALTTLFHGKRGTRDFVERKGASFEWMQQRMTL